MVYKQFLVIYCTLLQISPVSYEIEGQNADGPKSSSSGSSSSTSLNDLTITRTKSLEVLVPPGNLILHHLLCPNRYNNFASFTGKSLNELFPKARNSSGKIPDFEEPLQMNGQVRWQIIQVVSEGEITSSTPTALEGSPEENDRGGKRNDSYEKNKRDEKESNSGKSGDNVAGGSEHAHEIVYKKGVYLFDDATLRELRNGFIETEQLDTKKGTLFQFLHSDVVGDKIDIETEDEILLNQIEHSLTVKKTMFIEMIDPGKSIGRPLG